MLQVNTSIKSGRGSEWFSEAWVLFKKAPFQFMLLPLAIFGGNYLVGLIPKLGFIFQFLFNVSTTYGSYFIISNLEKTGQFVWSLMFDPIKNKFFDIILFSILSVLPYIIGFVLFICFSAIFITFRFDDIKLIVSEFSTGDSVEAFKHLFSFFSMGTFFIFFPILILTLLFAFGFYFGPLIIAFTNTSPVEAAKLSLKAMFSNIGAMTLAGLFAILFLILAVIPIGLGLFIYYPMIFLVAYRAFCDIFGSPNPVQPHSVPEITSHNELF